MLLNQVWSVLIGWNVIRMLEGYTDRTAIHVGVRLHRLEGYRGTRAPYR